MKLDILDSLHALHPLRTQRQDAAMGSCCLSRALWNWGAVGAAVQSLNAQTLQAKMSMKLRAAVSQLFLGDEALLHLGIPKTKLKYLLMSLIPFIYATDTCRSKSSLINRLCVKLGGKWQDHYSSTILERSQIRQSKI